MGKNIGLLPEVAVDCRNAYGILLDPTSGLAMVGCGVTWRRCRSILSAITMTISTTMMIAVVLLRLSPVEVRQQYQSQVYFLVQGFVAWPDSVRLDRYWPRCDGCACFQCGTDVCRMGM